MNLEYYKVFYTVATYGSISRAAERMYISQPAVSKAIRNLEDEMNCTLFIRTSHGSSLTPEGARLLTHVSRALKEFELGESEVSRADNGEKQGIRVGATESALYATLLPVLPAFGEKHPNVSFHIQGSSTSDLVQMLKDGTIDVALGVTPIPQNAAFPIIELTELRDVFFVHRTYQIDDTLPLTPQMLCVLPLVGVGPTSSAGKHIFRYFKSLGLDYLPTFTVETSTNVLPFVEQGLAIGVAPRWTLNASIVSTELRELNTTFSIPTRKIFLATNERYSLSPVCRIFIDTIKKTYSPL